MEPNETRDVIGMVWPPDRKSFFAIHRTFATLAVHRCVLCVLALSGASSVSLHT